MPVSVDLRLGDCLELMRDMPDGSIDLTVTSPPYDNLRDYGGQQVFTEAVWRGVLEQLYRVTKDGGVLVWIVNDSTIDGSETGTSFKQALYAKEIGFNLHDTMIWHKTGGIPFPDKSRYNSVFDYMFIFAKGRLKTVNLICDKKNKTAGTLIHGKGREPDGTMRVFSSHKKKKIKKMGTRNNVWEIQAHLPNLERTGHPAQFPVRLAQDHIVTWSNPGDTVLDPFSGSGTTGVACINTGRNYIGCEIDPGYYELAKKRLEAVQEPLCYV